MPRNGLVAWYPFTGSAVDSTGNGNDGTVNGATLTTDRFGRTGSAYYFSSANTSITGNTFTYPLGDNPRTISLWFSAKVYPGTFFPYALASYGGLTQSCGSVFGTLLWNQPTSTSQQVGTWQGCNGSNPDRKIARFYNINTWNHLVVTYDTGFQRIYLNDTLIDATSIGSLNTLNDGFSFGKAMNSSNFLFGSLDDIAIYNRALSRCEVHKLYDSTIAFTQQPQSITALPGTDSIFTVTSPNSKAQYQWQVNTGSGFTNLTNTPPYSGVNDDTLRITTITESMNNYQYRAILNYPGVQCPDSSAIASLVVIPSAVNTINQADLHLFPNPFTTNLNISWSGAPISNAIFRLTDITGRILWETKAPATTATITIPTTSIAPGFYTLHIYDGNTLLLSRKVIKQ
jgi:hypothetical protein